MISSYNLIAIINIYCRKKLISVHIIKNYNISYEISKTTCFEVTTSHKQ